MNYNAKTNLLNIFSIYTKFVIFLNEIYLLFYSFSNYIFNIKNENSKVKLLNNLASTNFLFIKVLQTIPKYNACINKDIYDNVTFDKNDIQYELINSLENKYNIFIKHKQLYSGTTSILFDGIYLDENTNKYTSILLKIKKLNFDMKLDVSYFFIFILCRFLDFVNIF